MIEPTDNSKGITFIAIVFILLAVLVTAGVFVFGKVVKQQKIGQSRNVVSQAKHSIIGYAAAYKTLPAALADTGARTTDDWGNTLVYYNAGATNFCTTTLTYLAITDNSLPIQGAAFIVMSKGPNGTNDTGTGPFTIPPPPATYDDIVEYSDIATLRATVCHNMRIITDSLPIGTEEVAYPSTTLAATDGTTPYTWSTGQAQGACAAGSVRLIASDIGICLNTTTGVLSGTPTTDGNYTFVVQISDAELPTPRLASKNLTIVINPNKPRITTAFLNKGTQDVAYPTATLSATGGKLTYTWSLTSGSLPAGLSLSAGGVISGTPTAAGTYSFTVTVTDSGVPVRTAVKALSIVIASPACATLTNTTPVPMAGGTTGSAYSQNITYTGGQAPVTCSIFSGTLPAGLSLAGCTISGTPTTAGTSSFTTRVTDSCGTPQTSNVATSITIGCPALTNTTPVPMTGGTIGSAYSQNITYTGGQAPVTCSIPVGTLPAGLTLAGCTISGTPTTAGTSSFTTRVVDSCATPQTSNVATSITISCNPFTGWGSSLPNATNGTAYSGSVTVMGGLSPYSWALTAGSLPTGISFCTGNITTTCNLTGTNVESAPGAYPFTVRVTDSCTPTAQTTTSSGLSITVNPDACWTTGITFNNSLGGGTKLYYKIGGGACTTWNPNSSFIVSNTASVVVYSNSACTTLYCTGGYNPITYSTLNPIDYAGDKDCKVQITATPTSCTIIDW